MGSGQSAVAVRLNVGGLERGAPDQGRAARAREAGPEFAAQSQPTNSIDRENFTAAAEIAYLHETDAEIADKLFTLFDASRDMVAYQKFVASFAMLIRARWPRSLVSPCSSTIRIQADYVPRGHGGALGAVANCMDFFGDMKLPSPITALVENIFEESDLNEENEIDYTEALCH